MEEHIYLEHRKVFELALEQGFFKLPNENKTGIDVSNYMYMGSERKNNEIKDFFKHSITRQTIFNKRIEK